MSDRRCRDRTQYRRVPELIIKNWKQIVKKNFLNDESPPLNPSKREGKTVTYKNIVVFTKKTVISLFLLELPVTMVKDFSLRDHLESE
jgi:hypothetical protein